MCPCADQCDVCVTTGLHLLRLLDSFLCVSGNALCK